MTNLDWMLLSWFAGVVSALAAFEFVGALRKKRDR